MKQYICRNASEGRCNSKQCSIYNSLCKSIHGKPHVYRDRCDKNPACIKIIEDFIKKEDFEI